MRNGAASATRDAQCPNRFPCSTGPSDVTAYPSSSQEEGYAGRRVCRGAQGRRTGTNGPPRAAHRAHRLDVNFPRQRAARVPYGSAHGLPSSCEEEGPFQFRPGGWSQRVGLGIGDWTSAIRVVDAQSGREARPYRLRRKLPLTSRRDRRSSRHRRPGPWPFPATAFWQARACRYACPIRRRSRRQARSR